MAVSSDAATAVEEEQQQQQQLLGVVEEAPAKRRSSLRRRREDTGEAVVKDAQVRGCFETRMHAFVENFYSLPRLCGLIFILKMI